jgi:hypothetical protein
MSFWPLRASIEPNLQETTLHTLPRVPRAKVALLERLLSVLLPALLEINTPRLQMTLN